MESFEEKLTRKIHRTFLIHVCIVSKRKSKNNRIEWKIFQGCFKTKKKKKHKEIEFHKNSIED